MSSDAQPDSAKKPYQKPVLEVYGTVEAMTKTVGLMSPNTDATIKTS